MTLLVTTVTILLTFVCQQLTDDASSSGKKSLDFHRLVEQLASPNEKPLTVNDRRPHVTFPAGYDRDAQKKVLEARQLLYDNFSDALPELFAAIDDQRYSITIDWAGGDGYYNESVGDVCRNIIAAQLGVHRKKISFYGPRHWHYYTYPISKEWWEENKDKSHRELQLVVLDWAIDRRQNDKEFGDNDRAEEVIALVGLRKNLASSKKPFAGLGMYKSIVRDR